MKLTYTQEACNSIQHTIDTASFEKLGYLIDKFKDFKKDCYTNEQTDIINDILCACKHRYNNMLELQG